MQYQDRRLTCAVCRAEFVFSAGEQRFYAEKGFTHEPRRCKNCKSKRGPADASDRQSQARAVTTTVCSQCGKETTLPFRPTQGRPVYCLQCYQQRRTTAAGA